ncbi:MAG: hypothetical protein ACI9OJ_002689 [Myxococcota bacterium]|jgi:hypothetical protein
MKSVVSRLALVLAGCLVASCASDAESLADSDAAADTLQPSDTITESDAILSDAAPSDAAASDAEQPDNSEVKDDATEPPGRVYTGRSIGGVSMGAMAANIALMNPGMFDSVGALGGYIDLRYMVTTGLRLQFGGFCELATLEANIENINDMDADPPVFCGPAKPLYELEFSQDFNHLHYDDNGAGFDRNFYMRVFRALTQAAGNFTSEPTGESTYLPAGIADDWLLTTTKNERCTAAEPIAQALSYNMEYNPTGDYPVRPLCDGDERELPGLAGADFDPTVEHLTPSDILLFVDMNDNGKRDYGEPLFVNAHERYEDTGSDGCENAREDGAGGCLDMATADAGVDHNGDNFHWRDNPRGTELNVWRDDGESYDDHGLDGVPETGDPGEDNGEYDITTAFKRAATFDAGTLLDATTDEELERLDFYIDGGIRDTLHAAVSMRRIVGLLNQRSPHGVDIYGGVAGRPGTLSPDVDPSNYIGEVQIDQLTESAAGRNVYVEYGNPNATQEAIDGGDGKHVGDYQQAINRVLAFLMWAGSRIDNPDVEKTTPQLGGTLVADFYSEGLQARREYYVTLPPGYDEPQNADKSYPVIFFLHGLGQGPGDMSTITLLTSGFMSAGRMPKAILVFPDGQCCRRNMETGQRECACGLNSAGSRACVDPDCKGEPGTCEVRDIPASMMVEECYGGSLYLDLVSNRWGEQVEGLAYGQSVMDLVGEIDRRFRTRASEPLE